MQTTPLETGFLGRIWIWSKRYGSYSILLISCIIMIYWSFFDAFLSNILKPISLLGVAIGCLTLIIIDFYGLLEIISISLNKLNHSSPEKSTKIEHFLSVSEAVREALSQWRTNPVREVKILASTTDIILPTIKDCRHQIGTCEVIIQNFDAQSPSEKQKRLETRVSAIIHDWFNLVKSGLCKEVRIYRTDLVPIYYIIIFDASTIVFGLLTPSDSMVHAVDFYEPTLIHGNTESGKKQILKFLHQYEILRKMARKVEENTVR